MYQDMNSLFLVHKRFSLTGYSIGGSVRWFGWSVDRSYTGHFGTLTQSAGRCMTWIIVLFCFVFYSFIYYFFLLFLCGCAGMGGRVWSYKVDYCVRNWVMDTLYTSLFFLIRPSAPSAHSLLTSHTDFAFFWFQVFFLLIRFFWACSSRLLLSK